MRIKEAPRTAEIGSPKGLHTQLLHAAGLPSHLVLCEISMNLEAAKSTFPAFSPAANPLCSLVRRDNTTLVCYHCSRTAVAQQMLPVLREQS